MATISSDKRKTTIDDILRNIRNNKFIVTDLFYDNKYYCFAKVYNTEHYYPLMINIPLNNIEFTNSCSEIKHHKITSISCTKNSILDLQEHDNDIDNMYDNLVTDQNGYFTNIDIDEILDTKIVSLKRQTIRFKKCVENLPYKLMLYTNSYMVGIHNKDDSIHCYKLQNISNEFYNKHIIITCNLKYFLMNMNNEQVTKIYRKLYHIQFKNISKFSEKLKDEKDMLDMNTIKDSIIKTNSRRTKCKATLKDPVFNHCHSKIIHKLRIADDKMSHLLLTSDQYIADKLTFDKHIDNNNKMLSTLVNVLSKK